MNPGYPIFAFLAFVLVLIPLPWHFQAWNAGTCIYMLWTALGCLIHFINSIVWAGNVEIHFVVYCDIATKLLIGLSVGIPCAALCITRRLYLIATVSSVYTTKAEKRRSVFIDVAIGVGIPVIIMALHYIVQGHRFDIYEDYGCWAQLVNMLPSYFLVTMWPIVIGLVSLVYSSLALHAFFRRRAEFNQFLSANQNLVSANRYFRLMALATINIVVVVPLAIYVMYLDTTLGVQKWVSWSDTKWGFSRVDTFQAWEIDLVPLLRTILNLNAWSTPSCGIVFFLFFGMAGEARRHYKLACHKMLGFFRIKTNTRSSGALPRSVDLNQTPSVHQSEGGPKWDQASIGGMPFSEKRTSNASIYSVSFAGARPSTPSTPGSASHDPQLPNAVLSIPNVFVAESKPSTLPPLTAASQTPPSALHLPCPPYTVERRGSDSTDLGIDVSSAYEYSMNELQPSHERDIFSGDVLVIQQNAFAMAASK